MINLFSLYARYDGPIPRRPLPSPHLDSLIRDTLHIIRARRGAGIDETLNTYVTAVKDLLRLEKARKTGQNK